MGYGESTPPVNVGDELDVKIEAVGAKGDGIARKDGFVLFVPGVKEGDQVRVKITKVLRKVGFAEVAGGASTEAPAEEVPAEPEPESSETFGEEEVPEEEPAEEPAEEAPSEEPAEPEPLFDETPEEEPQDDELPPLPPDEDIPEPPKEE